ncbi:MAG: winged helix-turn-helix domain-containing protein [Promethearchaeota archaeon]
MLNRSSKKENVSDLFDLLNKTKFQIFTFLNMYGKLSLTEIAQKLNKSKSTIHGHIKKMKEVKAINEEKRPIYSDPKSDKPKVFENVYSLNPEFGTEFDDLIPGLNPQKLTYEQVKVIIDSLLFLTKMRIANLNVQKQFFEKIGKNFEKEPEKMKNLTKNIIFGLFNPKCEVNKDNLGKLTQANIENKNFPSISSYLHLSPLQFNMFSEKFGQLCQLFYSEEFKNASSDEKPIIFMATAIPMKNFIEFLNK